VETVGAKHIIIATGSKPTSIPGVTIDKERVITSTEALGLKRVPQNMLVIGAGAIGLELSSVYARLGCKVSVIEYLDRAVPMMDSDLGRALARVLKKEHKIGILTSHKVAGVVRTEAGVELTATKKDGKAVNLTAELCLVAVGRKPYTENLGLEKAGVELEDGGRIRVDEHLRTNVKNIYAIGDVIRGPMLAHKAEEEGIFVAETIAGERPHIDYLKIPGVVYTWPEVAAVGQSEDELKTAGREYKSGKFFFRGSGRAKASGDIEGFVKVLADKASDEILGVHIIGARAADLIAEATLAMEYQAAAEDVARICHPHPTYSEALKEACLAATANRAIHM